MCESSIRQTELEPQRKFRCDSLAIGFYVRSRALMMEDLGWAIASIRGAAGDHTRGSALPDELSDPWAVDRPSRSAG